MSRQFPRILFTDSVKLAQSHYGSREMVARMETDGREDAILTWKEMDFIQTRDSFYMASVGDEGWPYVQFRGGPRGFLKVLDDRTLAYADYRGNRQYISVGNVVGDERVCLFLMDYANKKRIKILARAEVHDAADRPDLAARVVDQGYDATVERVLVYRVEGFDWNCPQHITPRFTDAEIAERFSGASGATGR